METENDIIIDKITQGKILSVPILEVAQKLGIELGKKAHGHTRMCKCFVHADSTPSLGLHLSKNIWKCFSCGAKGNVIGMVMQHEHLDFRGACLWLIREFHIPVEEMKRQHDLLTEIKERTMDSENINYLDSKLIEEFQSSSSDFTRALEQTKILTHDQVKNATKTFRLGCVGENVLFCYIDQENHFRDGKIMAYQVDAHRNKNAKPCSLSYKMKKAGNLPDDWKQTWCLFGLHQLAMEEHQDSTIAVVESEKTAVICSELLPFVQGHRICWMACGGMSFLNAELLRPLVGRKVMIFPDTDVTGETFKKWQDICQKAGKKFGQSFTVSDMLEMHASPAQKSRKIDVADFILEPDQRALGTGACPDFSKKNGT